MSRSYKYVPTCKHGSEKYRKRFANRRVRRILSRDPESVLRNSSYRKVNEGCECKWICTWDTFWKRELRLYERIKLAFPDKLHIPPDKQECYHRWLKWYHIK